jgi:nucleoid DNA-binding protein
MKRPLIGREALKYGQIQPVVGPGAPWKEASMNKTDLIKSISESMNLKNTEATRLVDTVFDTIAASLRRGEQVAISGFGTIQRHFEHTRHKHRDFQRFVGHCLLLAQPPLPRLRSSQS